MDWDAVDPLYDRRPEEFVAARNALVKELRAAGEREAAAQVAKLRRPTATAHALNHVARHRADVLEAALEARAALRLATEGAGSGAGADLREATTADRDATRSLVAAAREVLGRDDPELGRRVTGTVLAATVDPDVAATLRAGRLEAEVEASGFELLGGGEGGGAGAEVVSLAERAARRAARRRAEQADEPVVDRAAAKAAAEAAAEAERARRRARADREQRVERLARRVARLEGTVAEAEEALAAARGELDDARQELDAARAALAELE